jgi:hypothetical protein
MGDETGRDGVVVDVGDDVAPVSQRIDRSRQEPAAEQRPVATPGAVEPARIAVLDALRPARISRASRDWKNRRSLRVSNTGRRAIPRFMTW